jgi:hypothetical protein
MKVPQAQGSFGIPDHMKPEVVFAKKPREDDDQPGPRPGEVQEMIDEGFSVKKEEAAVVDLGPVAALTKLGIEFTPEDYMINFRKGSLEKRIKIGFDPVERKPIFATIRTLTPSEYDSLDECVAEEISPLTVTNNGIENRRSAWTVAFALVAINDRLIVKPVTKEDTELKLTTVDWKATAKIRKKAVNDLSTHIVNKILDIYRQFDFNVRLIMTDPESSFLEKP